MSKENTQLYDSLMRPLELDNLDKSLWNDKCDYIDLEKCMNFNRENYNLVILQLNVRSLPAHQHELLLLRTLENKGSKVNAILLCETFLTRH